MFKLTLLLLFVAISNSLVTCCFTEDRIRFYNASKEIFSIINNVSYIATELIPYLFGGHFCYIDIQR